MTFIVLATSFAFGGVALAGEPARLAMAGTGSATGAQAGAAGQDRWFSDADAERGRAVFQSNCAGCHGESAEGGSLGPLRVPPLNGSGHSAHHGLDELLEHVANGGARLGGRMPPFGEVLSEADRRAAIAYVQSLWPRNVYRDWQRMHQAGHHH
jgi:mono/diheme cytochrome c family protein